MKASAYVTVIGGIRVLHSRHGLRLDVFIFIFEYLFLFEKVTCINTYSEKPLVNTNCMKK